MPRADIWCFGFPCTDISVAGKQKGFFDKETGEQTRSGLFYEIIRLLEGLRQEDKPKWLLCENVKNLLSINGGWGFAECITSLGKAGPYDVEWQLFNTKYSYIAPANGEFGDAEWCVVPGIPQNRERVYLLSRLTGAGSTRKVFPIRRADKENTTQLRQIGEEIGHRKNPSQHRVYDESGVAPTLNTCGGGGREPHIIDQMYASRDPRVTTDCPTLRASRHGLCVAEPTIKQIGHAVGYGVDNPQAYRVYDKDGIASTLISAADGKVPWVTNENTIKEVGYGLSQEGKKMQSSRVFDESGISPTLTAGHGSTIPNVRAVLTPDREEKRQNGRRMKEDGEPMFTLTAQDRHGVAIVVEDE